MNPNRKKFRQLRHEYRQQVKRIQYEEDAAGRERQSKDLEDTMRAMFVVDMELRQEQLDLQSAKLEEQLAAYKDRKEQREQIISTKLEQVLNANKEVVGADDEEIVPVPHHQVLFEIPKPRAVDTQFHVASDKTENGVRKMKVLAVSLRPERRTRELPFVVKVEQTHTKVIDGKEIEFTVATPECRSETEFYTVHVPCWQVLEFEVAQDEAWEEAAKRRMARGGKK